MANHLLIVEDDELVQSLLAAYMKGEGYKVSYAGTGKEMMATLNAENIDLILLDLGLPDEDGLTLTRQIRARSSIPIIVITQRQSREDRLAALELGADDYLTKPFDPEELVLRVHNILDRAKDGGGGRRQSNVIECGGWKIDAGARSVTGPIGQDITLTNAEFNLLAALAKAPNRVLSRDYLLDAVSRSDDAPSDRLIDVLISRVRKKIEDEPKIRKSSSPWQAAAINSRNRSKAYREPQIRGVIEGGDHGWHRQKSGGQVGGLYRGRAGHRRRALFAPVLAAGCQRQRSGDGQGHADPCHGREVHLIPGCVRDPVCSRFPLRPPLDPAFDRLGPR
ncbi:MAG: response regulator transcription factor [Rhodospirillales bacterium]